MRKPLPLTTDQRAALRESARCELANRSLHEFVKQAWPILSTREYHDNWHIELICAALEGVAAGRIRRLIINIPPRSMKSLTVDVFFPAWLWIHRPGAEVMTVSHKLALATRDTVKTRRLIQSDWYQRRWGHLVRLTSDQNQKMRFENSAGGLRMAQGMDSGITGEGGDIISVNDPHNRKQAHSDVERQRALETYDEEISTRLNDPDTGAIVVTMQRLHQLDLTGHLLAGGEAWDWLCLPMEYDPSHPGCSPDDPRRTPGELLWPSRFSASAVAGLKARLGPIGSANQLQQLGSQKGGGVWKAHLLRFYHHRPERFDRLCAAWDMTFKQTADGSFVVGQVWGRRGADFFLLDEVRARMGFTDALKAVLALRSRWPNVHATLVEDKANGPAVMDVLRDHVPGLLPVDTGRDSKTARAEAVSPLIEAGNVYIPAPGVASVDTTDWLAEVAHFPQEPNDRVDAATHALTWMQGRDTALVDLLPMALGNLKAFRR